MSATRSDSPSERRLRRNRRSAIFAVLFVVSEGVACHYRGTGFSAAESAFPSSSQLLLGFIVLMMFAINSIDTANEPTREPKRNDALPAGFDDRTRKEHWAWLLGALGGDFAMAVSANRASSSCVGAVDGVRIRATSAQPEMTLVTTMHSVPTSFWMHASLVRGDDSAPPPAQVVHLSSSDISPALQVTSNMPEIAGDLFDAEVWRRFSSLRGARLVVDNHDLTIRLAADFDPLHRLRHALGILVMAAKSETTAWSKWQALASNLGGSFEDTSSWNEEGRLPAIELEVRGARLRVEARDGTHVAIGYASDAADAPAAATLAELGIVYESPETPLVRVRIDAGDIDATAIALAEAAGANTGAYR